MKTYLWLIALLLSLSTALTAQTVINYSTEEAYELLDKYKPRRQALIDGRTAEMFQAEHIKRATNIDAFDPDAQDQLKAYLKKKEIILYCTKSNRSSTMVDHLKALNYQGKIHLLSDGITGWKAKGYETIKATE